MHLTYTGISSSSLITVITLLGVRTAKAASSPGSKKRRNDQRAHTNKANDEGTRGECDESSNSLGAEKSVLAHKIEQRGFPHCHATGRECTGLDVAVCSYFSEHA